MKVNQLGRSKLGQGTNSWQLAKLSREQYYHIIILNQLGHSIAQDWKWGWIHCHFCTIQPYVQRTKDNISIQNPTLLSILVTLVTSFMNIVKNGPCRITTLIFRGPQKGLPLYYTCLCYWWCCFTFKSIVVSAAFQSQSTHHRIKEDHVTLDLQAPAIYPRFMTTVIGQRSNKYLL